MEMTKIPGPMRIIWGSTGAWWVGNILNPGFFSIAILMLCLVPVLMLELYFHWPQSSEQAEKAVETDTQATPADDDAAAQSALDGAS